jgi:hypothetical protein
MKAYVEFEISEGAYELSCPDALCNSQGIVSLAEISQLASQSLVAKHHRYRLNRGLWEAARFERESNFLVFLQRWNWTRIDCGVRIETVKQSAQLDRLTGLRRVSKRLHLTPRCRYRGPFCVQRAPWNFAQVARKL